MTAEEIKEHRKKCTCVDQVNDTMCEKCQDEITGRNINKQDYTNENFNLEN